MRHYHNLLYVSHGTGDESEGLKQALSLARNNQAPLKVLVVGPEFPKEFPEYQKKYEQSLLDQVDQSIAITRSQLHLDEASLAISIELLSDNAPVVSILQRVLRDGYDLVIKEAESRDQQAGFKAFDMDLLRKCPVAVWLCRPIEQSREDIRVAVAIDPDAHEPSAQALSQRLLILSRSIADHCNRELQIVSCWDYEFETFLRGNLWVDVPDTTIVDTVMQTRTEHRRALENQIQASGISTPFRIHHLRGKPAELIPEFIRRDGIDILVMGTLARTGIPGFMFGNTAENIVQNLSCSLMALKPSGFVSPIKV
jgi:nucleotide-binding universal stress UspA family protein